jgi:cystathionine gamma-synthase
VLFIRRKGLTKIMNDSSFEAMAEEIDGLMGIDASTQEAVAKLGKDTLCVHGVRRNEPAAGDIAPVLHMSSTFAHPAFGQSTGYCYGRCGNPTRLELEDTIAAMEGGVRAFALASGMAAIASFIKLFKTGDHIIVCDDLYGGTYRLFSDLYTQYGLEFSYIDTTDLDAVRAAMQPNTRAIFIEVPTNPTMKVADIAALSNIAHEAGAMLAVDNTFLTWYYARPFDFGADIVIYSGTKYLCGHNDILAGFLILKDTTYIEQIYNATMTEGNFLDPFDCWLMLRSLKTLAVRMDRATQNATAVFEALSKNSAVERVLYLGDPAHAQADLIAKQSSGHGAMISFYVDTHERALAILERVKVVQFAESLGGTESLITYPLVQTHAAMPADMRDALGINDRFLRLSVGLEDAADLIADLTQAIGD